MGNPNTKDITAKSEKDDEMHFCSFFIKTGQLIRLLLLMTQINIFNNITLFLGFGAFHIYVNNTKTLQY